MRPKIPFRIEKTNSRSRFKEQTKFPDYLAKLRECPCIICKRIPSEAAHMRMSSAEYNKTNGRNDMWCLSLCAGHHRLFPDAQHNFGESDWWSRRGINPLEIAQKLWEARDDLEKMQAICAAANFT